MRVKNLRDYRVNPCDGTRMDVALAPTQGGPDETTYVRAITDALRGHPHVGQVRTNWLNDRTETGFSPSHIIQLQVTPEYRGSGWNFPITFPGFLIFVCAWHGYVYEADVPTEISLQRLPRAEQFLSQGGYAEKPHAKTLRPCFRLRHCSYNRGFWSGTGWWFPGYGIHNIVTGAIFVGFDERAIDPFHHAADRVYGEFVADAAVRLLKDCGGEKWAQAKKP